MQEIREQFGVRLTLDQRGQQARTVRGDDQAAGPRYLDLGGGFLLFLIREAEQRERAGWRFGFPLGLHGGKFHFLNLADLISGFITQHDYR